MFKDNFYTKIGFSLILKEHSYKTKDTLITAINKDIAFPNELMKKENHEDLLVKLKIWE